MDINAAMNAFEALSQETRLSVVKLLVQAGPDGLPAGAIAEQLDCRQNTMSTHLRLLASSGLIGSQRQGRNIIYRADFRTVRELVLYLMEDCCAGNAAVCRPVAESLASTRKSNKREVK